MRIGRFVKLNQNEFGTSLPPPNFKFDPSHEFDFPFFGPTKIKIRNNKVVTGGQETSVFFDGSAETKGYLENLNPSHSPEASKNRGFDAFSEPVTSPVTRNRSGHFKKIHQRLRDKVSEYLLSGFRHSLPDETINVAIQIMDEYLTKIGDIDNEKRMWMVVYGSLMIACKNDNRNKVPNCSTLTSLINWFVGEYGGFCFKSKDLVLVESHILHVLKFNVHKMSSQSAALSVFPKLEQYCQMSQQLLEYSKKTALRFVCDTMILNGKFNCFSNNVQAAAIAMASVKLSATNEKELSGIFYPCTDIPKNELENCFRLLVNDLNISLRGDIRSIRRKYRGERIRMLKRYSEAMKLNLFNRL